MFGTHQQRENEVALRMRTIRTGWTIVAIIFLWSLFGAHVAADPEKEKRKEPDVAIQIDIVRNRLTLFVDGVPLKKYPIALGKPETPTPVGEWKVINKSKNWGSGFGTRWIGLNVPWGTYGIHGTNRPHSIGSDASHGCVRMFNRHIEELYKLVPLGAKVMILGHPLGESYADPRRIARGDCGADVMLVQFQLKFAGFYKGACNGRFDAATEQALKRFERSQGLQVDGVVGMADYLALGLIE